MRKAAYIVVPALMLLCFLAGKYYSRGTPGVAANATAGSRRILYYVDPMHPAYKSDKPGIAPDCGMQLEPVYEDGLGATGNSSADSGPGVINVSAEQQQLIGLRVEPVKESSGARQVRVLGRVVPDEARAYRIIASTDGYIQKVSDFTTGSMVEKDAELATFGAAEIVTAQQAFLGSTVRSPETRNEVVTNDWRNQNRALYVSRLRALGMSEIQLKTLSETMKVTDAIQIFSPAKGFILARNVSPGQHFDKGAELYRIADLSHVWIVADVYQSDARTFRPGTVATVTLPNQKKSLRARVSEVLPQFDPATRTMKLRLEATNPGFTLRPDMFVDVELPVHVPAGITVPVEALLDSGMKKRVFIDRGNGHFESREVETGWRVGDRVQVVKGLMPGEQIVVSGTFLVDSESRLRSPQARADEGNSAPNSSKTKMKSEALPAAAKDPVCGMDVKPSESVAAGNAKSYQGKTYYFCSISCRDKFHGDPGHYLASKSRVAALPDGSTMKVTKDMSSGHD